jgi:hypothetical protein
VETFGSTYAKAVEELSGKIFIPALICSLFVEMGPRFSALTGFGFWGTYASLSIFGFFTAPLILFLIIQISIYLFDGHMIGDVIGLLIMPLGLIGLLPDHFINIYVPYTQVTGVAILAWSFMLIRHSNFLNMIKELF